MNGSFKSYMKEEAAKLRFISKHTPDYLLSAGIFGGLGYSCMSNKELSEIILGTMEETLSVAQDIHMEYRNRLLDMKSFIKERAVVSKMHGRIMSSAYDVHASHGNRERFEKACSDYKKECAEYAKALARYGEANELTRKPRLMISGYIEPLVAVLGTLSRMAKDVKEIGILKDDNMLGRVEDVMAEAYEIYCELDESVSQAGVYFPKDMKEHLSHRLMDVAVSMDSAREGLKRRMAGG